MQIDGVRTSAYWKSLFSSPDFFLWRFDGSDALFVEMNRHSYNQSIFTDQRIVAASDAVVRIPIEELLAAQKKYSSNGNKASHFIFHMAHTGSTLYARALDIEEKNIVYREPAALRQLAVYCSGGAWPGEAPQDAAAVLEVTLALLARRYNHSGAAIIKANVPVNFILPQLLASPHCSRAIMLHSTLEYYLLSILKSDSHRGWLARIIEEMGTAIDRLLDTDATVRAQLTDAQRATCLWLAQHSCFAEALQSDQNRSLDAEDWFAKPKRSLAHSFHFFQQKIARPHIEKITASSLFTQHAKADQHSYSNRQRLEEKAQRREALQQQISDARRWVEQRQPEVMDQSALPHPLLIPNKS